MITTAANCRRPLVRATITVMLLVFPPAVSAQQKPCCSITSIDAHADMVSAKVDATGQVFQFKATNPALLQALKVGEPVYANFTTHQVSINGKNPFGTIVSIGPATGPVTLAAPSKTALPSAQPAIASKISGSGSPEKAPAPPPPCCAITAINLPAGRVTGRENSNGLGFEFSAPLTVPIQNLRIGEAVWANFQVGVVSLNGRIVCCKILSRDGDWFVSHGGAFYAAADPSRPAILLFHGLHGTAKAWTRPAEDTGVDGWYYDHVHVPAQIKQRSSTPGVGVFKVGTSDRYADAVNANNWFDFLKGQNLTVATWSQPGETFQDAYPSAEEAYSQFLTITQNMNPNAPPPIALIGHSRGGLLIRQLLKDQGTHQRVHWVVTLHTPHSGSELAQAPEKLQTDIAIGCSIPLDVTLQPWAAEVFGLCDYALEEWAEKQMTAGERELAPGGPVVGPLTGDTALPGVSYYTFGGISPTLVRYYAWFFTPNSALPQYKCDPFPKCEQYFDWEANASEIPGISPMLNSLPDHFVPEVTPGYGDSLVADARSRLPYATHTTDQLNHAEVLWDRQVQMQVLQILYPQSIHLVPLQAKPKLN